MRFEYQLYWPSWYKLWPYRDKIVSLRANEMYPGHPAVYLNFFCFGPFQMKWYSS